MQEKEIWGALAGSVAVIMALVGVLYNRINDDIKGHEARLDAGMKAFTEIGEKLVAIGEQIKTLQADGRGEDKDIELLQVDIRNLHSRLLTLEVEHKNRMCAG